MQLLLGGQRLNGIGVRALPAIMLPETTRFAAALAFAFASVFASRTVQACGEG